MPLESFILSIILIFDGRIMSTYLILFAAIAIIYYFQIHNRPAPKTDWEKLPQLNEYKKLEKSGNEQEQLCCRFCGNTKMNKRLLKSKKENPFCKAD